MLRRIQRPPAVALSALVLCMVASACDDDGEDSSDATTDAATTGNDTTAATTMATSDSGEAGTGRCAMDQAVLMCGQTECAFEPTDVDCSAACANIAAVCAANACDEQCSGLESDAALCGVACEASKGLNCSNVVFGCYGSNDSCSDVGTCVQANL